MVRKGVYSQISINRTIYRTEKKNRKNKQDPNKNNRPASSAPWKLPEKKTEDDHGKKE